MRKILAIVVVLLIALYPGAVWLTGRLMEQRMQQALAQAPQQTPYVRIVEQHYRRGWYRSEQDVTLELTLDKLLPLPAVAAIGTALHLQVHSVIHHGPLCGLTCFGVARMESVWVPGPDLAPILARYYGSTPPLTVSTRIGYFGGRSATVATPPLKDVVLPDGTHVGWEGLIVDIDRSRNGDHSKVRASMPHLTVRSGDGRQLEISALTVRNTSARVLGSLFSGDLDLRVDRVAYRAENAADFSLEKFRLAMQSPVASGYMDLAEQIGTGPLRTANAQLKEAHFDFTLRHLQLQALATIENQMASVNQQRGLSLRPDMNGTLAGLHEPLEQLLLAKPELRFDRVGVMTANGQILLRGTVRMPDVTAADFGADSDPKLLLQKLDVSVDLTAEDRALADLPALAAQAQQQLPSLAQQGLVTHENGHWHTAIRLAHGQTTVNGKAMGAAPGLSGAPPRSP